MVGIVKFARRLSVCPNTVRNWIDSGLLKAGEHFLHVNDVMRFPVDRESLMQLMRALSPPPNQPRPRMTAKRQNRAGLKYKA